METLLPASCAALLYPMYPAKMPKSVASRNSFACPKVFWDFRTAPMVEITNTLLVVALGVILADKLIEVNVLVLMVVVLALVACTTCSTRNAPRRSFSSAAVSTLPATNAAGRVVGVAISVYYPSTLSASVIP